MRVLWISIASVLLSLSLVSCTGKKNKDADDTIVEIETVDTNPAEDDSNVSEADEEVNVEKPVPVKELSGYFLKNTYTHNDSIDFIVINDQKQFDSIFGIGKTMNNTIEKPDFTNIIAAVALKPVKVKTEISLNEAVIVDNSLEIRVNINKGDNLTYTMAPVILYSLSKDSLVKNISLFVDNVLVKTIALK